VFSNVYLIEQSIILCCTSEFV